LRGLSRLHRSLQNAEAEVWVVWPCSPKETRLLAARWELPFPVLADEGGTVHRRYTGSSERVGLFVIDEYGVVEEAWVVPEETAWPDPESLLPLLRGLEHQCPE
jgi:peroxiredoxin